MTDEELTAALNRVTYKPGWSFRWYHTPFEGRWIAIRYTDRNSYHPEDKWVVCVRSALPNFESPEQFHAWLEWRLLRIESHECREWFHVDGKPLHDPHAEGANDD